MLFFLYFKSFIPKTVTLLLHLDNVGIKKALFLRLYCITGAITESREYEYFSWAEMIKGLKYKPFCQFISNKVGLILLKIGNSLHICYTWQPIIRVTMTLSQGDFAFHIIPQSDPM
jgi:hypothetical protein